MCNIVLCTAEKDSVCAVLENSYYSRVPFTANQTGCCSAVGTVLKDPDDNTHKIFFVYNDINLKVIGEYVFLCQAIDLSRYFVSNKIK